MKKVYIYIFFLYNKEKSKEITKKMTINEIKKFMKDNKVTYEELADKAGLSISTVKKIFSGSAKYPRIDTMQAIEKALGIDQEPKDRLKNIPMAFYDKLGDIADLSPEGQQDILKYIELVKFKEGK